MTIRKQGSRRSQARKVRVKRRGRKRKIQKRIDQSLVDPNKIDEIEDILEQIDTDPEIRGMIRDSIIQTIVQEKKHRKKVENEFLRPLQRDVFERIEKAEKLEDEVIAGWDEELAFSDIDELYRVYESAISDTHNMSFQGQREFDLLLHDRKNEIFSTYEEMLEENELEQYRRIVRSLVDGEIDDIYRDLRHDIAYILSDTDEVNDIRSKRAELGNTIFEDYIIPDFWSLKGGRPAKEEYDPNDLYSAVNARVNPSSFGIEEGNTIEDLDRKELERLHAEMLNVVEDPWRWFPDLFSFDNEGGFNEDYEKYTNDLSFWEIYDRFDLRGLEPNFDYYVRLEEDVDEMLEED